MSENDRRPVCAFVRAFTGIAIAEVLVSHAAPVNPAVPRIVAIKNNVVRRLRITSFISNDQASDCDKNY
jgi:hypothetical protein